jgi:hypothetical protein
MPAVNGVPRGLIVHGGARQDPMPGGARRHVITKDAVIVTKAGAGDGLAHDFAFTLYNPSSRLRAHVEIFTVSNSFQRSVTPNGTWSLRAVGIDERDGKLGPMQNIWPASGTQALPDGYELTSAVRAIYGTALLPSGTIYFPGGTANGVVAQVVLQATWEPNEEPISPSEMIQLFAGCSLALDGPTQSAISAA